MHVSAASSEEESEEEDDEDEDEDEDDEDEEEGELDPTLNSMVPDQSYFADRWVGESDSEAEEEEEIKAEIALEADSNFEQEVRLLCGLCVVSFHCSVCVCIAKTGVIPLLSLCMCKLQGELWYTSTPGWVSNKGVIS